MMKILSIAKVIQHNTLHITSIKESTLDTLCDIETYSYIIINGGDGTIRRVLKQLHDLHDVEHIPTFILNPTGSFNVVAKIHRAPKIEKVLEILAKSDTPFSEKHHFFKLNDNIFLFSAGNMGDLQHIVVAETLRFGWLKNGMAKYIFSALFLLPMHIIITPFMLSNSKRFFIFTPLGFIKKIGNFYGEVKEMHIDLENSHNLIELDGDVEIIKESKIHIKPAGFVKIVASG